MPRTFVLETRNKQLKSAFRLTRCVGILTEVSNIQHITIVL